MISIIIVNYHVKKELFDCLQSIYTSKPKSKFEILVVDNDEQKTIKKELLKKFPDVIYLPNQNKGFGQGNNVGSKKAKGEYLFFLNPDTKVFPHAIDKLINFLEENEQVAVVAPLLLTMDGRSYQQGTQELTPIRGIFALSIINKIFPNNPFSKNYWLKDWERKTKKEVGVVPGTAFVIRKKLFTYLNGFDEKFFLYFEEFDLCRRIKHLGKKLYIIPEAKVAHSWGASTKKRSDIQKVFNKSRFHYFHKNFGLIPAILTEAVLRINKYTVLLTLIILLGAFLRLYTIKETMPFSGDQGWFYMSARDMLLHGTIPYVGIASSHPWLHQGAYWTYLLAIIFKIFGFSPYNGAYLSVLLDVFGIVAIYCLGKLLISSRLGIIAAFLYATSPLVIINSRMPYHTSPIPLCMIITLYFFFRWVNGQTYFFPAVIFMLAVLYNFEIVTFLLSGIFGSIFIYGLIKKQRWALQTINPKILLLAGCAFILCMLPMIIYDFSHGFPQTVKFLAWIGYRVVVLFGYQPLNPFLSASPNEMAQFFITYFTRLIFPSSFYITILIVLTSFIVFFAQYMQKQVQRSTILFFIISGVLMAALYFTKTPSEAYLPMLFPLNLLLTAYAVNYALSIKSLRIITTALFTVIVVINIVFLIHHKFTFVENGGTGTGTVSERLEIVHIILKESEGKEYNLAVETKVKQSAEYAMNYAYLAGLLGHGPSTGKQSIRFVVVEKFPIIKVRKEIIQ